LASKWAKGQAKTVSFLKRKVLSTFYFSNGTITNCTGSKCIHEIGSWEGIKEGSSYETDSRLFEVSGKIE
jgi:hypothetical protein